MKRAWIAAALSCAPLSGPAAVSGAPVRAASVLCERYSGLPDGFARDAHAGMLWVEGGEVVLGSTHGYPEERGGQSARVDGFWLDRTEVTNAQFARFVAATGYVTQAEREGSAPVFAPPAAAEGPSSQVLWLATLGADWRHPRGPGQPAVLPNHPVVQVTHADALAYARWLGHELPSELQWEHAARSGGAVAAAHEHAEPRDARGKYLANYWQGDFPARNTRSDGYAFSAPVGCFPASARGVYDMLGNVWEWTDSPYTASHRASDRDDDPPATDATSCTTASPLRARFTLKGGSFLCAPSFCARYRAAARHAQEADQPAMHIGFRTVSAH